MFQSCSPFAGNPPRCKAGLRLSFANVTSSRVFRHRRALHTGGGGVGGLRVGGFGGKLRGLMDDDAPHRMRWSRVFARVGGYTLVAVVLYVLSIGPASYLLLDRSERLERAVIQFYAPIDWLYLHLDLMDAVIQYQLWWCELPGGPADRVGTRLGIPKPE